MLAKSPSDPLHQRLQQFRCLHYCSDCYRVERTSSRAGIPPLWTGAFHGARKSRLADFVGMVLANPVFDLFSNTRSEEHTSELQSLAYLVCRLLLEKKK